MDQSPRLLAVAALCSIVFSVAAIGLPIAVVKALVFGARWDGCLWALGIALAAAAGIIAAVWLHRD